MSPELLEEEVFLVAAGGATAFLTTLYTVKEFSGSQPLAWTPSKESQDKSGGSLRGSYFTT